MAGVKVDRVYVGISGEHVRAATSLGVVAVMDDEISSFDLQRVHEVGRAVAHPPDRELLHAIPRTTSWITMPGSRIRSGWRARGSRRSSIS